MPEDQNGSPAPEATDGHVHQQEPAHKPSVETGAKPQDDDSSLDPNERPGSSQYTTNTGTSGKHAIGDHATFNETYNNYYQHVDKSQIEQCLEELLEKRNQGMPDAFNVKGSPIRGQKYQKRRGVAFASDEGDHTTTETNPILDTPEALSDWYYDLNDYDQCFVQVMAVFDGATVGAIGGATKKLFASIQRQRKGVSSMNQQSEDEDIPGKGPRRELLVRTYTKVRRISMRDCYLWQDADSSGASQFKLRVLHFLAEEAPTWFDSAFLRQLHKWAGHLTDDNEYSALHALGVIYWHDREDLESMANNWAGDDEDWYRAAYLLEGAYEADRKKYGAGAHNEKKSPVLQIVQPWVKHAHAPAHVNEGCAAALTYALLGNYAPQLALKGLDALLELPRHAPDGKETGIPENLYEAVVLSYLDLAVSGHVREVLQHLAQRMDRLSRHRLQLTEMKLDERERHRRQRQLNLIVAFDTFFRMAALSLTNANAKNAHWVTYNLTQTLPSPPSFANKDGREMLLAGILIQDKSTWRADISTLLCAAIIEQWGDFAFFLLRQWADIVLKDQSAYPNQVRKSYVQFMAEVGTMVNTWCHHLQALGFRPPPVTKTFQRKLGQWLAEGQRRNLPIGALAQEVIDLLYFP